jgi:hypothetical protein
MKYSYADWGEKRQKGIASFLFIDGILRMGAPFAFLMQIGGYFLRSDDAQSYSEYFMSSQTWITFFFHATLFGLVMGFINWRRAEKAFAAGDPAAQDRE